MTATRFTGTDDSDGIACWFCQVCRTLTLLREALADHCCQKPRRSDCPLPLIAVEGDQHRDRLPDPDPAAAELHRRVSGGKAVAAVSDERSNER